MHIGEMSDQIGDCLIVVAFDVKSFKHLGSYFSRAILVHGRNQSMVQPEMRPGNFLARVRNFSPTGDKHKMMCKLFLAL
jgi:hypothetical protein